MVETTDDDGDGKTDMDIAWPRQTVRLQRQLDHWRPIQDLGLGLLRFTWKTPKNIEDVELVGAKMKELSTLRHR